MPAYFIADASVKNAAALQAFRSRATAAVSEFGGRYLVRTEAIETLEGTWTPETVIVIEFPDLERARNWYRSNEYALALAIRDNALSRHLILVDGLS